MLIQGSLIFSTKEAPSGEDDASLHTKTVGLRRWINNPGTEPLSAPGPVPVIASDRRERGDLCVRRPGGVVGPRNLPGLFSPHHLPNRAPFAALAMTKGVAAGGRKAGAPIPAPFSFPARAGASAPTGIQPGRAGALP